VITRVEEGVTAAKRVPEVPRRDPSPLPRPARRLFAEPEEIRLRVDPPAVFPPSPLREERDVAPPSPLRGERDVVPPSPPKRPEASAVAELPCVPTRTTWAAPEPGLPVPSRPAAAVPEGAVAWPELPVRAIEDDEPWRRGFRDAEHRRRLDLEQRGNAWSE